MESVNFLQHKVFKNKYGKFNNPKSSLILGIQKLNSFF